MSIITMRIAGHFPQTLRPIVYALQNLDHNFAGSMIPMVLTQNDQIRHGNAYGEGFLGGELPVAFAQMRRAVFTDS